MVTSSNAWSFSDVNRREITLSILCNRRERALASLQREKTDMHLVEKCTFLNFVQQSLSNYVLISVSMSFLLFLFLICVYSPLYCAFCSFRSEMSGVQLKCGLNCFKNDRHFISHPYIYTRAHAHTHAGLCMHSQSLALSPSLRCVPCSAHAHTRHG